MNFTMAYSVHTWNINTYWSNNNQALLGKWVEQNIGKNKVIMIDIRDCTLKGKEGLNDNLCYNDKMHSSLAAFWISNPIIIGYPSQEDNADYLISMHENDDYLLINTFGNFKIYKL